MKVWPSLDGIYFNMHLLLTSAPNLHIGSDIKITPQPMSKNFNPLSGIFHFSFKMI